jgi:uncharacterized lipoprotein YehR (DUF1307 family)
VFTSDFAGRRRAFRIKQQGGAHTMKRVKTTILLIVITLIMVVSLSACGTGQCVICNQSGFFLKTVVMFERKVKVHSRCYNNLVERTKDFLDEQAKIEENAEADDVA